MIAGHDQAVDRFERERRSGRLHHAWLLGGPKGVGKASFARAAATRVLAVIFGARSASLRTRVLNPPNTSAPFTMNDCAVFSSNWFARTFPVPV